MRNGILKTLKWGYKVVRGILFTAIILMVVLFVAVYTALSIPPVQDYIRDRIEAELSGFLGSRVMIRNLTIHPLNEVIVEDAHFFDLKNKKCLEVNRLGAGINLWRLLMSGEIEITYVELLDFKANVYQEKKDGPLNIDFIIKAFEPKDKNKPPARFDLKIHNIVLRGGEAIFAREWAGSKTKEEFDLNHVNITDLNADITIPRLSNDETEIDLRHLSLNEKSGLQLKELKGFFKLTPENISVKNFELRLPESEIKTRDFILPLAFLKNPYDTSFKLDINLHDSRVTPSNLSMFYPPLSVFDSPIPIELSVSGNKNLIMIDRLKLGDGEGMALNLKGFARKPFNNNEREVDIEDLSLNLTGKYLSLVESSFPSALRNSGILSHIDRLGFLQIDFKGSYDASSSEMVFDTGISSDILELNLEGKASTGKDRIETTVDLRIPRLLLSEIVSGSPVDFLTDAEMRLSGIVDLSNPRESVAGIDISVGSLSVLDRTFSDIACTFNVARDSYHALLSVNDSELEGDLEASLILDGENSEWDIEADVRDFDTYNAMIVRDASKVYGLSGKLRARGKGDSPRNLSGTVSVSDFNVVTPKGKEFNLDHLSLVFENNDDGPDMIELDSEIASISMAGDYDLLKIPGMVKRTLGEILPSVFNAYQGEADCGSASFEIEVRDVHPLVEFFNIPLIPLTSLTFNGSFDSSSDFLEFKSAIPYIQQGTNTLITDTYIDAVIHGAEGKSSIHAGTLYPTKKGLLKADLTVNGNKGEYGIIIDLNKGRDVEFYGNVGINLLLAKDPLSGEMEVIADWMPSKIHLSDTDWNIEEAKMIYDREEVRINNFSIRHDDQFIVINGYSTRDGEGEIKLDLADINVDYVFETLNIPHVTFGGSATGTAIARKLFSPEPDIHTENFFIKDFSYNGAVVGDGKIEGSFSLPELKVSLGADISRDDKRVVLAEGGVWVGRDSLAFKFDADKVDVGVIKPFMHAFSSDLRGTASGKALLYGTFSDIDMTGTLVADNVEVLIDYINARYTTSGDTVYMYPGRIELPKFNVKDRFGKSAILSGVVSHRYFHDPTFTFTVSDMDGMLVYNTNAKINPLWYGTIFASGAGEITGSPGLVSIKADVETEKGSDFTFVLSDQLEAVKSSFLTFSDRKKEAYEAAARAALEKDTVPDFLKRFQKKQQDIKSESTSDVFTMDIRASVTEDIRFNLIMDPAAGDKITAYGNGAMTMGYSSLTDELRLYGKYILEKGTYNFSLQDIILKEFTIKPGSSIAFTGDPYTGVLDLTAAYKVNTSLTELDRSFANDRELNRTSVPVEALLEVTGVLTSPNIAFDIDLPTVTEETAQKVRSIISTDDMMSRQVLYLVALNKFYPPEYMSTSNSGGEWASIATSTLSSQIQNMIGQLTDKFSLAPSIKSDKGDFSDIEFDLGLSSQLFNNRLLINGNLGYRDPSNSSTTFIGDFDLEYLLNKKGNWRLKAYNHFNDQNYYLKSSLTTQGIGIVWRKDFGIPRDYTDTRKDSIK